MGHSTSRGPHGGLPGLALPARLTFAVQELKLRQCHQRLHSVVACAAAAQQGSARKGDEARPPPHEAAGRRSSRWSCATFVCSRVSGKVQFDQGMKMGQMLLYHHGHEGQQQHILPTLKSLT